MYIHERFNYFEIYIPISVHNRISNVLYKRFLMLNKYIH